MGIKEEFEKLDEIARVVSCDEVKWCDVYNWYRTDNTDANSIYHVAWLNGAWYAFQEQQKKINDAKTTLGKIYKETEGDDELLLKYLDEIQELLR